MQPGAGATAKNRPRVSKTNTFSMGQVCSDTIGGRGRMLRDVIMQIPYCK